MDMISVRGIPWNRVSSMQRMMQLERLRNEMSRILARLRSAGHDHYSKAASGRGGWWNGSLTLTLLQPVLVLHRAVYGDDARVAVARWREVCVAAECCGHRTARPLE